MKRRRYSRWIMVDGQPVHICGDREPSARDLEVIAEIARAAQRKVGEVMEDGPREVGHRPVNAGDASA